MRAAHPEIIVIIRSSDINQTALAASAGVHDYIDKDADGELLAERLFFNAEARRLKNTSSEPGTVIGETINSLKPQIDRIKHSAVKTVHIHGETGSGKEVVAKLFGPIRTLDCGAIPENLVESELFGHKRGAFTGATQDKKGALDVSTGGWIFLDEIGNISLATQAKLLRAIGEKEISPIGATDTKKVNFKLITATNVDQKEKAKRAEFREDLRQRLTEFEIPLPPLRERTDEIDGLIDHFCRTLDGGPYTIEPPARNLLKSYDYQEGNIRELRRAIITMTANKLPGNILPYRAIPQYIADGVSEITGIANSNELMEQIRQIKEASTFEELAVTWRPGERWEMYWDRCLLAAIRFACKDRAKSYRELAPIGLTAPQAELLCSSSQLFDIIDFPEHRRNVDARVLHQKYVVEGATTAQIAKELLCSKSTVRAALLRANIPLREKGPRSRIGQVAFGTKITRGRAVPCGTEQNVIQIITDLRRDGLSFDKIAAVLTKVGVPTKTRRRKWNGGSVRSIFLRRNQDM